MRKKTKFDVPLELIGLEEGNYHLLVKSVFNQDEVKYWILDTGASKSVFDATECGLFETLANEGNPVNSAGIGSHPIETSIGILAPVGFADFVKSKFEVALIDLDNINDVYGQFCPYRISGLLGSDFMVEHHALIDYRKRVLTLYQ